MYGVNSSYSAGVRAKQGFMKIIKAAFISPGNSG